MSSQDARSLAGQKLGNYRLQRILGRGNMGVVYLATDEALLRPTAVKILAWAPTDYDPEAWFLAEARSVARLNHPSVIQIYSVARHGSYCYIAMEYVDGVSADVLVARRGVFSPERATEVVLQMTSALDLAHGANIIHRDVKPANILIKHDGTAKLGDFGTAMTEQGRSRSKVRAGTPHYFAPEIWRGEPATVATDLYALGATYYYLVTGRPPFDAAKVEDLAAAHQGQAVPVPAALPAVCLRVIQRALAKAPGERFESARAMAWELRGALRELEAASVTGGPTPSAELVVRRDALRPASAAWRARGFAYEPFADLDPSAPPASAAPFDGLRRELAAQLQVAGTTLILAGPPRSGRSTLARWLVAVGAEPGATVNAYIDLAQPSAQQGSLARRIARAFGAVGSSTAQGHTALEGLLDTLSRSAGSPPVRLVVVDGVTPGSRAAADLAVLARAARTTRYFSMLVLGPGELAADLADAGRPGPTTPVATMPALTGPQVRDYLASWLAATRRPEAPPLIISVDAALLVAHRSEGQLARINALARELVAMDARVLTSWEAWSAPDGSGEPAPDGSGAPGARPDGWPTPEILEIINRCRAAAGVRIRAS
ncbi:MAG TPA: serine/threonine-protein kinase [Kofleriaceae bacterium]